MLKSNYIVSIVIPTRNRVTMLGELLESVAAQLYRPVEVVVVDDGSTDNTAEVVRSYKRAHANDSSLSCVYELTRRGGAQRARNRGIEACSGDAIMFIDSDDILCVQGLQELATALGGGNGGAFAYGRVQTVDDALQVTPASHVVGAPFDDSAQGLFNYHWHTMGALYTRECIDRVGEWNTSLKCSQDWEYQVRAKLFGGKGVFVDTLVGYWRQHSEARIGAKEFSDEYLESTRPLFMSIYNNAVKAGRSTPEFEALLARRLIVHAVACGANGRKVGRSQLLDLAFELSKRTPLTKVLVPLVAISPPLADLLLTKIHTKLRGM